MDDPKLLHILLVDDDAVDVMNVQRAFKRNNILNPLYVASDGLEALATLRGEGREKIPGERRLILLDLNMPRMNGLEFLRELREDPDLRHLTVVVLTTSDDLDDEVERLVGLGASEVSRSGGRVEMEDPDGNEFWVRA